MEVALSRRDIRDPTAFEPVVQQFTTNKDRARGGRGVVLKFVKQTGLGGRRRGGRLGGSESVKDVGCERGFRGQGGRRLVEERRQKMGADGGLAGSRFTPAFSWLVLPAHRRSAASIRTGRGPPGSRSGGQAEYRHGQPCPRRRPWRCPPCRHRCPSSTRCRCSGLLMRGTIVLLSV